MNRFETPTEEELEKERICIICREEMTVDTAKKLPGCGHIFRKSCLREWLVQQQTCPTCRGDISAMEARQKMQDRMDALAREQGQENQNEEQDTQEEATDGTEDGTPEENGSSSSLHACCNHKSAALPSEEIVEANLSVAENNTELKPPPTTTVLTKPSLPVIENNTDRKPPPATTAAEQQTIPTKPSATSVLSPSDLPFPAFYRVVRDSGASVFRDEKDESCYLVTRIVPCGVVFVGTKIEHRKCVLTKQMMIQMPDGWVNEECVERIAAVPIEVFGSQ